MKKTLFGIIAFFSAFQSIYAQQEDPPRYLQTIFDNLKVKTALEFGISSYTQTLLESSSKVISVDFITHGHGPGLLKAEIERNQSYSNWIPIAYFTGYHGEVNWAPYRYYGSESVYKAISHAGVTHESYALIDDFYITELNSFITNLKKCYKIDLAHIGGAMLLRGELIQIMFGKIPVIIGCHTRSNSVDLYGYNNLVTPDDYEEIYIPTYNTTVWVSNKEEYRILREQLINSSL